MDSSVYIYSSRIGVFVRGRMGTRVEMVSEGKWTVDVVPA